MGGAETERTPSENLQSYLKPPTGMVNFSHDKSFNGTCAPTIYILGCSATARRAFVVESRVWLALSLVSFIALIAATIYRFLRVSESFNTLRLVLVCYLAGCVPYVSCLSPFQTAGVQSFFRGCLRADNGAGHQPPRHFGPFLPSKDCF